MDTRKLAKVIKLVVERELKRQLPKLIKEGVNKVLNEQKRKAPKQRKSKVIQEEVEVDPFSLANSMLDSDRITTVGTSHRNIEHNEEIPAMKQLSKNPVLNEILNNTQPFQDRGGPPQYDTPAPINENHEDMDKTLNFDSNIGAGGAEGMRTQMAAKMGYGGYGNPSTTKKEGLGVSTGLPGLDRILNRDNSTLVKQFKTRK